MDGNLAWLTLKSEDPKCNKGNFAPPPLPPPPHTHIHTQNVTESQSNKKVAAPPFLHQPPLFRVISPVLATFLVPTPLPYKSLNFWKVLLPPFNKGAGGGGVQLCLPNYYQIALSKIGSRVTQR